MSYTLTYQVGDRVKIKDARGKHKDGTFEVYGYANPDYNDLVYIIDKDDKIQTVNENQLIRAFETMKYKGYRSTPNWNDHDQVYYGHLEGLFKVLVNWESDDFEGCRKAFEEAVDDFLIFCEDAGLKADME